MNATFAKRAVWLVGALVLVGTSGLVAAESSHEPFDDVFDETSANDWNVVKGDESDWLFDGRLSALANDRQILLDLPDIEWADDRLLELDFNPLRSVTSLGYSGFSVQVADLFDLQLGLLDDLITLRVDVVQDTVLILDQDGSVLDEADLTSVNVLHDRTNHLKVHVKDADGEVDVTVGQGSNLETVTLEVSDVPDGTVSFYQPVQNTAQVLIDDLKVRDTPSEPRELTAEAGPDAGQISLSWEAPEKDGGATVTTYHIYRGEDPDAMELIAVVGGATHGYTDVVHTGLVPDTETYHYQVAAKNRVGVSPSSAKVCAMAYPAGTVLTDLPAVGCGSADLVEGALLDVLGV